MISGVAPGMNVILLVFFNNVRERNCFASTSESIRQLPGFISNGRRARGVYTHQNPCLIRWWHFSQGRVDGVVAYAFSRCDAVANLLPNDNRVFTFIFHPNLLLWLRHHYINVLTETHGLKLLCSLHGYKTVVHRLKTVQYNTLLHTALTTVYHR